MKKSILFLIVLMLGSFILCAQENYSTSSKKAIQYFEEAYSQYNLREYEKALEFLDKAISKDDEFIEAYIIKGQVYEGKRDYEKARQNYLKAIGIDPDFYPNLYYSLGLLNLNMGKYEGAKKNFKEFMEFENIGPIFKDKAEKKIESCNFAIHQLEHPVEFKPENIGVAVNSKYDEYWPSISADGEVLVITRLIPIENLDELERQLEQMPDSRRKFMLSMNPKEQEDFFVSYKTDTGWTRARNMGKPLSTKDNEGAQSLSADGKTMYFSACNKSDGKGSCDIYVSHKKGDDWSKPKNIGSPVNTSKWESQPSISPDGRTLYFASNRKGGYGQKDIWKSSLKPDSTWSKPVNLGDSINTYGNDQAPFIHMDNQTLYFSSDGWNGMGNLDLFKSTRKNDSSWTKPHNLGYPINTHKNEIGLIVNSFGNVAYYSSNRKEENKKDIYTFKLPQEAKPVASSYMKGRVYDAETNEPLRARFELISLNDEETVMESFSDKEKGEFLVCIPSDNNYVLNVSREDYLFYSDNFELEGKHEATEPFLKDVPLKPIKEGERIILRNVFYELDSYKLKENSKVELNKLYKLLTDNPKLKIEISGYTDSQGTEDYNNQLSKNRARSVYEFLVKKGVQQNRLSFKGYGESRPIAPNDTPEGRALNRRTEIKVIEK